jgi:hypothetical protein
MAIELKILSILHFPVADGISHAIVHYNFWPTQPHMPDFKILKHYFMPIS